MNQQIAEFIDGKYQELDDSIYGKDGLFDSSFGWENIHSIEIDVGENSGQH